MASAATAALDEPGVAPALTVGQRLDRLPVGAFHWRLIGLIGGGLFVDVYDQTLAGAVLAALVKSGQSNLTLNGWFLSSTFLRRRPTIAATGSARAVPNSSCRRRSASTTFLNARGKIVDADLRRHDG